MALAKREVYGAVDIDSIAGPSEIVVLADDTANPVYVAADLLSQAEHDEMASAILVTNSATMAEAVQAEVKRQLEVLPRRDIAAASVEQYGAIIVVDSIDEGSMSLTVSHRNTLRLWYMSRWLTLAGSKMPVPSSSGRIALSPWVIISLDRITLFQRMELRGSVRQWM